MTVKAWTEDKHITIFPKILYFGTPVVLLTTLNLDGTSNITPMSSSWALEQYVVLGLGTSGKALENMQRHPECVINLPSPEMWRQVESLASLTGKHPVPDHKKAAGFRFEADKFAAAALTPLASELVKPDRIEQCPLQLEGVVRNVRIPEYAPGFAMVEVEVVRVHASQGIVKGEHHINPAAWRPLIYNFRHYFSLGEELGKTFRSET